VLSGSLNVWAGQEEPTLLHGDFYAVPIMTVTTELGDVVLGPPGTTPADLDQSQGA
jgi:hypothetical protein